MRFELEDSRRFENLKKQMEKRPLVLTGGGGGFQGQLPQSRVTFDPDELEDNTIPSGVSLVTNLNRIRYRISQLEAGTGVDVEQNSTPISQDVTVLNFAGGVVVTETTSNEVLIQVIDSGTGGITDHGGLTGLFPDDDHPQYHNDDRGDIRYYTQTALDGGILNDLYMPITDIETLFANVINGTIFNAKGDLIVASGNDGFGILAVGNDDEVLIADSTQLLGVRWAAVNRVEYEQIVFTVSGQNLSTTGVRDIRIYSYLPVEGGIIREIFCYVSASPSTQALRINIRKNGSSIITGGYVQIPVASNSVSGTSFTDNTISNDDYFQFEIVQGDSSAANLTIHLRYTVGD